MNKQFSTSTKEAGRKLKAKWTELRRVNAEDAIFTLPCHTPRSSGTSLPIQLHYTKFLFFFWWSQMSRASFNNRLDLITECWRGAVLGTWKAWSSALNTLLLTGGGPPWPPLPLAPDLTAAAADSEHIARGLKTRMMSPNCVWNKNERPNMKPNMKNHYIKRCCALNISSILQS